MVHITLRELDRLPTYGKKLEIIHKAGNKTAEILNKNRWDQMELNMAPRHKSFITYINDTVEITNNPR